MQGPCARFCLVDRDDLIAEIVAKKISEIGASGFGDPAEISKLAIGLKRASHT